MLNHHVCSILLFNITTISPDDLHVCYWVPLFSSPSFCVGYSSCTGLYRQEQEHFSSLLPHNFLLIFVSLPFLLTFRYTICFQYTFNEKCVCVFTVGLFRLKVTVYSSFIQYSVLLLISLYLDVKSLNIFFVFIESPTLTVLVYLIIKFDILGTDNLSHLVFHRLCSELVKSFK